MIKKDAYNNSRSTQVPSASMPLCYTGTTNEKPFNANTALRIAATLQQYYKYISVGFCEVKLVLRCILKCEKLGCHFLCQSLLLGTSVPNDKA